MQDVTRGSEYASAFGSAAMHQALDALFDKGQLQLLLLAINPERPGSSGGGDGAGPVYDELSVSLYVAAVSLCTQVASTPYGAKVLLENGILERINGVETLRAPPTGAGIADDPFAPARDASIRNLEEQVSLHCFGRIWNVRSRSADLTTVMHSSLCATSCSSRSSSRR